jgi:hypothetical protein
MLFFTKEWYALMQDMELDFKKIPDGNYTDAEIDALYQKQLKKEIASERKFRNSESFWWSHDELRAEENFDPAETIQYFETAYQTKLKYYKKVLPAWMTEQVDRRLLALNLLPESAFLRYRGEIQENKKEWNKINRAAKRTLSRQNIPDHVAESLRLHDAALLSIKKSGKNYVMLVRRDGLWPDDPTPYRKVVFHQAVVLEKEAGLRVHKLESDEDGFCYSNISFLYHEIYRTDTGYEAHMMFWVSKGLAYLTIACADISFEDGVLVEG